MAREKNKTRRVSYRVSEEQLEAINKQYEKECPMGVPTKTDWVVLKLLNKFKAIKS